jgi:hypothetical protein
VRRTTLRNGGTQVAWSIGMRRNAPSKCSGGARVDPLTMASSPSPFVLSVPLLSVAVFQKHATVLCDELYRLHMAGVNDPTSPYATSGIDVQDYFLRFTLDSFSHIGFGFDMHSICAESNKFATAFDYVQSRCFNRMDYGVFWPWIAPADKKFKAHLKYMDDVVYECIAKAKAKSRAELQAKQLHEPDLLSQTLIDMTGMYHTRRDVHTQHAVGRQCRSRSVRSYSPPPSPLARVLQMRTVSRTLPTVRSIFATPC